MGDLNQVKEEKIKNLEGETTPNKKNNMNQGSKIEIHKKIEIYTIQKDKLLKSSKS